jgi:hypothetical protein
MLCVRPPPAAPAAAAAAAGVTAGPFGAEGSWLTGVSERSAERRSCLEGVTAVKRRKEQYAGVKDAEEHSCW